jgi:hypothetical protein
MGRTISYRTLESVSLLLHTKAAPSPDEYDAWLADLEHGSGRAVTGVFVYSFGGGPNAAQRRQTSEMWKRRGVDPRVVLVTPSTMARGIATAFSWIMSIQIAAYSPHQLEAALKAMGLSNESTTKARRELQAMCAEVGLELAA